MIAEAMYLKDIKNGENIITFGEEGREFYILKEGKA